MKIQTHKKYITAIGILIFVAVLIYFYFNNPVDKENFYVSCTFKNVTGWDCAGCGAQRSVHYLLHGNWLEALRYNALFVVALPYVFILIYYAIRSYLFGKTYPNSFWFSGKMALIFVAVLVIYTLIRNLPFFPFIYLATPN